MKALLRPASAGLLVFVLASPPILACCDDFWSCAGAVASGGLTCVVEAAVLALKEALGVALKVRNDASADFDRTLKASVDDTHSAIEGWRKHANDAADDAKRSAEAAAKLLGDEHTRLKSLTASGLRVLGGAVPTPTPLPAGGSRLVRAASTHAIAEALLADNSLEKLHEEVNREHRAAEASSKRAQSAALQADAAMAASEKASREAFAFQFLTGMGELVVLLQDGISNPVKAVATAGIALQALTGLETALSTELAAALRREADKRAGLADAPHGDADTAEAHAKRARDVLDRIRRAVLLQTVAERQELARAALSAPTPAPATHAGLVLASTAALSTFASGLPARTSSLRTPLSRVKSAGPPDVTPFRGKVSADLASQFKGKTPAAADATRAALFAEARRRFATDPKTLSAVEKLVTEASKVR